MRVSLSNHVDNLCFTSCDIDHLEALALNSNTFLAALTFAHELHARKDAAIGTDDIFALERMMIELDSQISGDADLIDYDPIHDIIADYRSILSAAHLDEEAEA